MKRERMRDLQSIFNDLLAGKVLQLQFFDKAEYESVRTSLLRKFRMYRQLAMQIGPDPFEGHYLQARFDKLEVRGVFQVAPLQERTPQEKKLFKVTEL